MLRDALFFRSAGIRRMTGLPIGRLAEPVFDSERDCWEGEWHRLLRCLDELGQIEPEDSASWDLRLSDEERRAGREAISGLEGMPFIAAAVGSKLQSKDWGEANWRALLERVTVLLPGYGMALVGAASEKGRAELVSQGWRGRVVNLCGRTTPRVLAEVLSRASLFVGHDSGSMHLAARAATPCVAVYAGVCRPGQWYPYGNRNRAVFHRTECMNCGLEVCVSQAKKCILSISVEEVYAAVAGLVRAEGWEVASEKGY